MNREATTPIGIIGLSEGVKMDAEDGNRKTAAHDREIVCGIY